VGDRGYRCPPCTGHGLAESLVGQRRAIGARRCFLHRHTRLRSLGLAIHPRRDPSRCEQLADGRSLSVKSTQGSGLTASLSSRATRSGLGTTRAAPPLAAAPLANGSLGAHQKDCRGFAVDGEASQLGSLGTPFLTEEKALEHVRSEQQAAVSEIELPPDSPPADAVIGASRPDHSLTSVERHSESLCGPRGRRLFPWMPWGMARRSPAGLAVAPRDERLSPLKGARPRICFYPAVSLSRASTTFAFDYSSSSAPAIAASGEILHEAHPTRSSSVR